MIFKFYSQSLIQNNGYITHHGKIDFKKAETIFNSLAKNELESLKKMLNKLEKTCNERKEKKEKLINDHKILTKKKKINGKKIDFLYNLKQGKSDTDLLNYKKEKIKNKLGDFKNKYSEIMAKIGRKEYKFEDDVNEFSKKTISDMIKKFHKNSEDLDKNEKSGFSSDINLTPQEKEKKIQLDTYNKELNEKIQHQTDVKENLGLFFDSEGDKAFKRRSKHDKENFNNITQTVTVDPTKISEDQCKKCLKNASKFINYIKVN